MYICTYYDGYVNLYMYIYMVLYKIYIYIFTLLINTSKIIHLFFLSLLCRNWVYRIKKKQTNPAPRQLTFQ